MSERPPDTVAVPKSLLLLMVLVLVVSLMLLSFLVGRQSAPTTLVVAPVTPPVAPTTTARSEDRDRLSLHVGPPPVQRAPEPPPEPVDEEPEVVTAPQAVAVASPKPRPVKVQPKPVAAKPVAPAKEAAPPADAAKIRQYLADVEAITAGSGDLGDPTEFATGLLHQSMLGDTSGFDQLLGQVKSSQARLAKVTVPPACKEHHRLATSQLKGSLELLQDLKQAMLTSDSMALAALSAKGQSMQGEAQQLQRITRELQEKSAS